MPLFTGISAAIGAISTFVGGLGAFGSFLLQTAVGTGLNLLAASLAGKEKPPSFSLNGGLRGGGDLARHFIIGKYSTAGSLVWANTWGRDGSTPNAWLTQVIAISDLPSKGLSGLLVDGKRVTYGVGEKNRFGYSIPEYEGNGPNMYVMFYDGTQTVADPALISDCSTSDRMYSASRVGVGVTYAIVHSRSTRNMFSGFPLVQFEIDGTKLYDISKDDTQGGVGSHRYSDPSTWGGDGDENPAVQLYNLFRGINYGGRWLYGLQSLPASRLPALTWIYAINKARAPVQEAEGMRPTYRSSGEIDVSVPVITAAETLLTTCQGRISEIGGTYMLFLGAPGDVTVSFSDGDILSTDEQTFTPFTGIADSINGVSATYPSQADNWNVKTAPPLLRSDLEAKDGNRRLLASIELSFVPYDEQVQRLMKSALEEALRYRRHTISLPPEFWPYAIPGEIIQWNSVRNGYINKLFRIDGATDSGNLDILLDITEVDPLDYNWNSGIDFQPVADGVVGVIRPPPQTVIGWNAVASAVQDNTGVNRRPAITLSWSNAPQTLLDVRGVSFDIRNKDTGKIEYRGYTNRPDEGSIIYSQGLLPANDYEVQGRYDVSSDRLVSDSGWLAVRTLDIRLTGDDVYLPGIVEEVQKYVGEITEFTRDAARQLILEQERVARLGIDQDFGNFVDKQTLRREAVTTNAKVSDELYAATGPGSALAGRLTLVEAITNGGRANGLNSLQVSVTSIDGRVTANSTAITSLTAAIAGKADASAVTSLSASVDSRFGAQANAITSLSAGSVGGDIATANFRMSAGAGPGGGYGSRIGLEARAGGGGSWRAAGMFIDVPDNAGSRTRITMIADEFILTDGANSRNPFIFSGGAATLNVANIGTVNAGIVQSTNGRAVFNLTQGFLSFSDAT